VEPSEDCRTIGCATKANVVLVVPVASARQLLLRHRAWNLEVAVGQTLSIQDVLTGLEQSGYTRVSEVDGEGQYAVRGGIVDVWPREMNRCA